MIIKIQISKKQNIQHKQQPHVQTNTIQIEFENNKKDNPNGKEIISNLQDELQKLKTKDESNNKIISSIKGERKKLNKQVNKLQNENSKLKKQTTI